MNIGERIKILREKKGYTLEELGQRIGVGKSTVRKWENGMIKNMRRDKIAKLAEVLDCSPLYLLGYNDSSYKNNSEINLDGMMVHEEPAAYGTKSKEENERIDKFISLYSQLGKDEQLLVDNMIEALIKKQ